MRHRVLNLSATLLALASLPALAAETTYTIDSGHTQPYYEVSHFGFSLQRGRFTGVTGKIGVDLENHTGSVDVTIDSTSVQSGHPKLDEHLRNADFFNAAKFPTITYRAREVRFDGDHPVLARGEITLLGVTKNLVLHISNFRCGKLAWKPKEERCGGDATATLFRSDFGMTKLVPGVADEVHLRINLEATRELP
jgi:polyisoprenoid-binding protein YceI